MELRFSPSWSSIGAGGGTVAVNGSGAISLIAGGTNQNITLTPSGTGVVSVTGTGGLSITRSTSTGTIGFNAGLNMVFNVPTATQYLWNVNGSTQMNLLPNGLFLLGTTTDSSNGRIQLATHTTSAGGIGFGTDGSLYRQAVSNLRFVSTSINPQYSVESSGVVMKLQAITAGSGQIGSESNHPVIFLTNNTTALTLDSSQNATFAAQVRITNSQTPASAAATGTTGTIAWDASYFYVCTASNTWRRVAHATW